MLTLLSPAKKLDLVQEDTPIAPTTPRFLGDTKILAKSAKTLSADDLKKLMGLSDNLANLNADRFRAFVLNGRSNGAKPAAFTFDGNVYEGLEAETMNKKSLSYAQDHLRILSGLYGVLRPMDEIQPYRLEMGTRLENPRGKNLYAFWGDGIATALNDDMQPHAHKGILNLASNEYFKAVDRKTLKAPVIDVAFLNIKNGQARALMYYAKRARGLMARWVMDNEVDSLDGFRGFDGEGYKIDQGASDENKLVFTRKQPPPIQSRKK